MGIHASIYRSGKLRANPGGGLLTPDDCTLNGWSGNYGFDHVCVVNAEGPFEPDAKHPAVLIVRHRQENFNTLHAVSVAHHEAKKWTMMGGNFLYSSDSRFGELCVRLMAEGRCGIQTNAVHWSPGAVAIHDRVE